MSVSETHVGVVDGESVPHSGMHTAGLRALNCLSAVFSVTCVPRKRWLVRGAVCYATHSMTTVWCLGSGLPACPCSAKSCICRAPPARVFLAERLLCNRCGTCLENLHFHCAQEGCEEDLCPFCVRWATNRVSV